MITRRTALALTAAVLPRVAIGQPERPSLTVAVQKIANTGTLDPLREQSSNASDRYLGLVMEQPILRNQQAGLERVPGLAAGWRRVDERTVDLTIRPDVVMHDGRTLTAEDVAFTFGPRMFGPNQPNDLAAVAKRYWPALECVEVTGPLAVRFVNRTPDVTMEGRLAAVARTQGRSKSDIAREAVRRYVELHDEAFRREARRQSQRASRRDTQQDYAFWETIEAEDADESS